MLGLKKKETASTFVLSEWVFFVTGLGEIATSPAANEPIKAHEAIEKEAEYGPCEKDFGLDTSWLTPSVSKLVGTLSKCSESLAGLPSSLRWEASLWQIVISSPHMYNVQFPGSWDEKLTLLQRLCLVRCLRPEQVSE